MEPGLGVERLTAEVEDRQRSRILNRFRLRLAGHWVLWIATTGVLLLWWLATAYTAEYVEKSRSERTTQTAVVSRIEDPDDWPTIFLEFDGREYELADESTWWSWSELRRWLAEDVHYDVGDHVEVALDDDVDPTYRFAYDVSRYTHFSWSFALTGLLFSWGLLALVRSLILHNALLPERARWQRWRTRKPFTVNITEVREVHIGRLRRARNAIWTFFDRTVHTTHHLVVEKDGVYRFWAATTKDPIEISPGTTIEVIGSWRHRGWIVGLTEPALYPAERLD